MRRAGLSRAVRQQSGWHPTTGSTLISRGDNDRGPRRGSRLHAAVDAARSRAAQTGFNRYDSEFASPFGDVRGVLAAVERRGAGRTSPSAHGLDLSAGVEVQRERAGSTSSPERPAQESAGQALVAGFFGEGRWNSRERALRDRRRSRRRHPARAARGVADPFSPAARPPGRHGGVGEPAARRGLDRPLGRLRTTRSCAARRHRHPSARRLRARVHRQPGLRPERSKSAEAGVDQAFAGGRAARRSHGVLQSLRRPDRRGRLVHRHRAAYRTDNISNARARGLELALDACAAASTALRRRRSRRRGSATPLLDTEILAVDQDDDRAAAVRGRAGAAAAPAAPVLRGRVAHQRPRDRVPPGERPRHDARRRTVCRHLRRTVRRARLQRLERRRHRCSAARFVEVFGRVENLFDRSYEEAFGFPALGRGRRWGCGLLQAADVSFRLSATRRSCAASRWTCRPAASSASSGRTAPARPRCCGSSRARGGRRSGRVLLDGAPISVAIADGDRAADGGRAAGDAPRVRLHRARSRADGTLSAPRHVRGRGPADVGNRPRWRSPRPAPRRSSRGCSRRSAAARSSA